LQSRACRLHYPAKKKAVGINLSPQVVDYFKVLADGTGLRYQKLMFLIGNVSRTLFLMERDALRKKRRLQRREEHRSATATSKIPVTPPNLNYRRVFLDKVFGHEISGHSYEAHVVEIGNELGSHEIGIAKRIRAYLTYLDKENEVLQRICPARWRTQEPEISIRQGESGFLGCGMEQRSLDE